MFVFMLVSSTRAAPARDPSNGPIVSGRPPSVRIHEMRAAALAVAAAALALAAAGCGGGGGSAAPPQTATLAAPTATPAQPKRGGLTDTSEPGRVLARFTRA